MMRAIHLLLPEMSLFCSFSRRAVLTMQAVMPLGIALRPRKLRTRTNWHLVSGASGAWAFQAPFDARCHKTQKPRRHYIMMKLRIATVLGLVLFMATMIGGPV